MKSLTDYSPDNIASVGTMTWFSKLSARTQTGHFLVKDMS